MGVNNNANATTPEVNLTGGDLNVNRLLSVGGVGVEGGGNGDGGFQGAGKGKLTVNSADSVLNVTGEIWAGQGGGSNGRSPSTPARSMSAAGSQSAATAAPDRLT